MICVWIDKGIGLAVLKYIRRLENDFRGLLQYTFYLVIDNRKSNNFISMQANQRQSTKIEKSYMWI